jgi:putative SOS response-associated peptidase YedK
MCGRYKMTAEQRQMFDQMPYLEQDEYFDIHGWKKQPEVFPGTEIFAVNNQHKAENIWWTIEDCDQKGIMRRTINAKAENVRFAQMFKEAFRNDRVLIPATGLFEWQDQPDKTKVKYEIWFDEPVFAFAGIARDCEVKKEMRRCGVILTTRPNEVFSEIHNSRQRQAVVIRKYDYDKWLDPETPWSELERMMAPLPASETHFARVTDPISDEPSLPLTF